MKFLSLWMNYMRRKIMKLIDKIKQLKDKKKQQNQQIKLTNDENLKSNIQKDKTQTQIDIEKEELKKAEQEQQKLELIEETHYLINRIVKTLQKIGLITSKCNLSESLGYSKNYLSTLEIYKKMPKFETLTELKLNISEVLNGLDNILYDEDIYQKENIKKIIKHLCESLEKLQQKIILKMLKI